MSFDTNSFDDVPVDFVKLALGKKDLEELKTLAKDWVEYAEKKSEYTDLKVEDNKIKYTTKDSNTIEIENWTEYFTFVNDVESDEKKIKNFTEEQLKKEKEEETTPWYKQWWVWLLIILAILVVLGLGYYMMKGKKGKK